MKKAWVRYAIFVPLGVIFALMLLEAISVVGFKSDNFSDGLPLHSVYYRPAFGRMNHMVMTINQGLLWVAGFHVKVDHRGRENYWVQIYSRESADE